MFRGHSLPHRRRLLPRVVRPTIAMILSLTVIAGLFTGPLCYGGTGSTGTRHLAGHQPVRLPRQPDHHGQQRR